MVAMHAKQRCRRLGLEICGAWHAIGVNPCCRCRYCAAADDGEFVALGSSKHDFSLGTLGLLLGMVQERLTGAPLPHPGLGVGWLWGVVGGNRGVHVRWPPGRQLLHSNPSTRSLAYPCDKMPLYRLRPTLQTSNCGTATTSLPAARPWAPVPC